MKKYKFTVFGTATTVKVMQFHEFPKVGRTTLLLNSDFERLYFGGKAWNIAYSLMMLGLKVFPVISYSDKHFLSEFNRLNKDFEMPTEGISFTLKGDYGSVCYVLEDRHKKHITFGGIYSKTKDLKYALPMQKPIPIRKEFLENSEMALLTRPRAVDLQPMFKSIVASGLPMVFSFSHDGTTLCRDDLDPILKYARVIFANTDEISYIEKFYGYSSITDLFTAGNSEIIVKTLGKDGSLIYEKTANGIIEHHIPITETEVAHKDVCAIGAGDAYVAGFCYGLSIGADIATCGRYGSTVASFVIEDNGSVTNSPTLAQMLQRNNLRKDIAICKASDYNENS